MAKILFISDNFIDESIGIMGISSYLKMHGHDVRLTLLSEYAKVDDLLKFIIRINPDFVGFSVMTSQVNVFRGISKVIKEQTRFKIIWGGAHCTFMPEEVIKNENVDIICLGEGEEALLMLMNKIDDDQDYSEVPNLWVKKKDGWVKNSLRSLETNLDKYPFPDRNLYYNNYPFLGNFTLKRILTQRGCPCDCNFCFNPLFKDLYKLKVNPVRRHSVEYIIDEIKTLINKYPTKSIHFSDDNFSCDKKWVMDFLPKYKREINLPFTCNISVANIDEDIIINLKELGCNGVSFGIESGIEDVRMNLLNKKIPDKVFIKTSQLLRKHNLKFIVNLLLCLPNETIDEAVNSVRFAASLKPFGVKTSILKIYKGIKLAKFSVDNDLVEGVGEFTYKVKDNNNEHNSIKNMTWAAYFFIKFPFLLYFAKRLLKLNFYKLSSML
ncbi:MAG: B12-binding domain-containing radical SAM protein, partial [Candidatus Omnitrophica bacterium]|nr:B12-binding domain-containing radical SAM protein [Candidatus Omnitrophota bacterium]